MVIGIENDSTTRVQYLDMVVCISQSAHVLWKGMNPTILPSVVGK